MNEYIIFLCDDKTGKPRGKVIAWGQAEQHAMMMARTRFPDAITVSAEWTGASMQD